MSAQIRQMAMETLPEGQCPTGRVEVLPVQWRKHLKLEVCRYYSLLPFELIKDLDRSGGCWQNY